MVILAENFVKVTFAKHGGRSRQGLEMKKLITAVIAGVPFLSIEVRTFFVICLASQFSNLLPRDRLFRKKIHRVPPHVQEPILQLL